MLFNSLDFAIFLPIVFIFYWFVTNKSLKFQNLFLVIASYIFYGWWDWRFLTLIAFSSLIDYLVGIGLLKQENRTKRKMLLLTSIIINLGLLGFFKYYNFFLDTFISAFTFFGNPIQVSSLNIVLPVGISFYTFQTLSYSIDVYKRKLQPTKDIISFFAFVSFFPQLVAGPIERASNLLPQFYKKRTFEYSKAVDGLRQILWGLFKKIVIADNCAQYANEIFNNYQAYSGYSLILGALFFTFQVYGDFSGYSDIAIGTSRLFGFNLMQNFAFPFFSRDIGEFWRRWHISLSTWFRDYLYIPLGGSRGGFLLQLRNIFAIFMISGFWHGANYTFIVWGALNAIYFLPLLIINKKRTNTEIDAQGKNMPGIKEVFQMLRTFGLFAMALIIFRANNVEHAFIYFQQIISGIVQHPLALLSVWLPYKKLIALIIIFFLVEWFGREQQFAIEKLGLKWYKPIRWAMYYGIVLSIFLFAGKQQQFVYFQF